MTIKETILNELHAIEEKYTVKVLFAVESGSRGWGFASPDSDYDVRFVYKHPPEWYLSIDEKRDVIERPVDEVLDIGGWDFRKMLRLAKKSNAVIWEWLQSPIVYINEDNSLEEIYTTIEPHYSPVSCGHHYLSMAKRMIEQNLTDDGEIVLKKYFYILRPLLAALWIVEEETIPPMEFSKLLAQVKEREELFSEIEELVAIKKEVVEKHWVQRVEVIDYFIEETVQYVEAKLRMISFDKQSIDEMDDFYREIVGGIDLGF